MWNARSFRWHWLWIGWSAWIAPASLARAESLDEAWSTAVAVDQQLAASRWNAAAASQSLEAAKAARMPNVWLRGGYAVLSDEQSIRINAPPLAPTTLPYIQSEGFQFSALARLPIYTSGQISHGIDAASEQVASAARNVQRTAQDLKLEVATSYVGVLRAQRQLDVSQRGQASLEAHSAEIERRHGQELARRNEMLAARVALLESRQQTSQALNRLDLAQANYNRHMGRPLDTPARLDDLPIPAPNSDLQELTARALTRRPELAALAAQSRGLCHQAQSLRASTKPQVGVDGGYRYQENQFQTPQGITSVMLGVEWNVFDGGAKRRQATAMVDQSQAINRALADLKSMIELEVREAALLEQESRQRVLVAREAIVHAQENLKVAKDRYQNGLGTIAEVLAAEARQMHSASGYFQATYDAVLSTLRLRRATGDL